MKIYHFKVIKLTSLSFTLSAATTAAAKTFNLRGIVKDLLTSAVEPPPGNNPNDPTAPGAQLVDVGQSCCGECWCVQDGEECPLRTTAFPQLYTEGMVSDFSQKTLVDPDTLEVVPSNNLYEIGCDPYEGVSQYTNTPWKAYGGCELTPPQTFNNTSAAGYDEAVCAFSYPEFDKEGNCDTYTYKTYASAEEAEEDGAYVTLIIRNAELAAALKIFLCTLNFLT